jgi:serine/threonine protein kinase
VPPRPTPPPAQKRWFQERPSQYPWEQDGLDHVRRAMPQAEPYRAWATFSFTAASGRIHECDLLIAVPGGLYLVELKAHPGHVANHGDTWTFAKPGSSRVRTLRNPLHFTDVKSKDLKSRLQWAAKQRNMTRLAFPRIEPVVFLTDPGLVSALDEVQRERVYGRDDAAQGLPWIWRDLLAQPPRSEQRRVTPVFSKELPKLLEDIGVRASTAHLHFGDDWTLDPSPLDAGPTWEDRLAERSGIVHETGRVRIYLTEMQAGEDRRRAVERAARREYQVLQGIAHRGIAQAVQIREHHGGPAILFHHDARDLRLDSYLDVHGARLTPDLRLDLVRQLAEAVQYAHGRSLFHRALAARSIYVSARDDGSSPVLRVIDWQAAARDFEHTVSPSLGLTSLGSDVLRDVADLYLAPEFDAPYPDPVDLDVFGLGALAYLLLTGQAPATDRAALIERLASEGGLHPYAVDDAVPDRLDALVFAATRSDPADRLDSAEAFLRVLDVTEEEIVEPDPEPGADPLTATPGQVLDGGWTVARVLGTGATARALLVRRPADLDDDPDAEEVRVLKVALDEQKAATLEAEGGVLDAVGGGLIVKKLDGPRRLGNRTVLDLQYGGGDDLDGGTLGSLLRAQGKLTYHQLERFGKDLLTVLDQLAGAGVRHRDLKPDNFAVYQRADRVKQLLLMDFSLAAASERDVAAGTRGYLDPFLGTPRRPAFDDHAEWYAAAVTLHEMASTTRPIWGDGVTDPRTSTDPTPTLTSELFEPALRDGLVTFFRQALHRDTDRRFETLDAMHAAWRDVFAAADAVAPATTPATVGMDAGTPGEAREAAALAATRDTPLEAAGLSPRAVSVAQGFEATTVGELLDVPLHLITRARGAGAVIRKELIRRYKQWAAQPAAARPERAGEATSGVDQLVELLLPAAGRGKKAAAARLTLALPGDGDDAPTPWTAQSAIADRLGITQAAVSRHQQALFAGWAELSELEPVREELAGLLAAAGRVMTAAELESALRARHGPAGARAAAAVVRAAVEAEIWAGMHPAGTDDEEQGPRLAVLRRRDGRVLVALESLPGSEDPSAAELADYAWQLAAQADRLAVAEPMPGRSTVVQALRDVPAPAGLAPLADTRLVGLAAATSLGALVTPRLELYPRTLDLVTALRISQAGAGVRRTGVTVAELLGRVRARFPDIAVPLEVTYVEVQGMLHDAGFALVYDLAAGRFVPVGQEGSRRSLSSSSTMLGHGFVPGTDVHETMRARLAAAVDRGGFLALTLRGKHAGGAARALAGAYPVREVDLGALFVEELRALAAERGQDWQKVLTIDARFSETGRLSPGLGSYARATWERVHGHVVSTATGDAVLLAHDAGLLGRYAAAGGHDLLVALQARARTAGTAPHGLWLLCPGDSAATAPKVGGLTVEAIGPAERLALDGDFLDGLRRAAPAA